MEIEAVWSEYRSSLKAFLHSKVSDSDEVDDLLQEVLIKTYRNLHTVKSQKSVKSWLFQIANHAIIDFYRQRHKTADLAVNDFDESDLWYRANEPDLQQSLANCITPFIHALSDDSAALLMEVDLKGKSQKAYAQQLGINYSTLKSRVHKSRRELRSLFEDCCHLTLDKYGGVVTCDPKQDICTKC